ncbi:MAG: hypothetical protein ACE5HI_11695 [bacterium]
MQEKDKKLIACARDIIKKRFKEKYHLSGMCRELISEYAPEAKVIIPGKGYEAIVSIKELLPIKYQ